MPYLNEQVIEADIRAKGLTAPRVTPHIVDNEIWGLEGYLLREKLHIAGR